MVSLPTFEHTGSGDFDVAITGVLPDGSKVPMAFIRAESDSYPYVRETAEFRKEQIDATTDPGEQSLQAWWVRAQPSFHLGAGVKFLATAKDEQLAYRFADSCGVDVWTSGQATLLRRTDTVNSASGNNWCAGFSSGGEEGVLHTDGTALKKVTAAGAVSSIDWGGTSTIYDLITDGGAYYVACDAGIYRGALDWSPSTASDGVKAYTFPASINRAKIGWAKQRLIACANQYVWELTALPATPPDTLTTSSTHSTQLDPVYKHPTTGWVWSDVAEGPGAVYLSGYSGDQSAIYAMTLKDGSLDLNPPVVVAQLPRGEVVYSINAYLGSYLVVGTNKGVRVAQISDNGTVTMGQLSIESDRPVYAATAFGKFIWAGGSQHTDAAGVNRPGLYRLNLSAPIPSVAYGYPQQTGAYAWARDIYRYDGSGNGDILSVAPIGTTGRIAFTVKNVGLVMEQTTYVANGWLETPKITFDTAEDKIFQFIRTQNTPTDDTLGGTIKIQWRDDAGVLNDIATYDTEDVRAYDTDGSDGVSRPMIGYRFTLAQRAGSTTNTPVFLGYQAKAQPSMVRQRMIRLTLLAQPRESTRAGATLRSTWDRIAALEAAETLNAVVRYQDLGTGENRLAIIEKIQYLSTAPALTRSGRQTPGGLLLVTLRTVT